MGQHLEAVRLLPAVNKVLQNEHVSRLLEHVSFETLSEAVSESVNKLRSDIISGNQAFDNVTEAALLSYIIDQVTSAINQHVKVNLKPVINATGVVLHTNLGRSRLSRQAVQSLHDIARSYSNLEYRLETGQRGSRNDHLEHLLCSLTGAESAMVVNNNAAAVFLILNELASGKEAIVSRGQLVEIGGSFRISEIMNQSGVRLVEVGTTNKTHLSDYEKALTDETALLMKVHTSNFRIVGFTQSVETDDLVALGERHRIPVYEDAGSGVLIDLHSLGIHDEPTVAEVIKSGVDLVSFSGDKLLGGPQAGLIVGKKKWIDRLKKNQLARVLRVDKFTLAALQTTLLHYIAGEDAARKHIPTLRAMFKPMDELKQQASTLASRLKNAGINAELCDGLSAVGGGSLPDFELPTVLVSIQKEGLTPSELEAILRTHATPIIGRIQHNSYLLDLRTVEEDETVLLADEIINALKQK